MAIGDSKRDGERPLTGWKEIAAFFGKDERTVKRWEVQRGLPIHRVPGHQRATVYAWPSDLDAWLTSADGSAEVEIATVAVAAPPRTVPRFWFAASFVMICAAVGGTAYQAGALRNAAEQPVEVAGGGAPSIEARDLYLAGMYNLDTRQADGIRQAIALFTQAVTKDPDYAAAYAGLADGYNVLSHYTSAPPEDAYPRARAAAERAIQLDPDYSGGYAALAFNTYYWKRDFKAAQELFERAVALDNNNARTHHWYALAAMPDRRFDIALREIALAQALDPSSPVILASKALILFYAGDANQAETMLLQLATTQPKLQSPPAYLAMLYLAGHRYPEFLREYRRAAEVTGNAGRVAIANAAQKGMLQDGPRGLLIAMLEEQKRQFDLGTESAFRLALTAALLGETQEAIDYLNISLQRQEQELLGIRLNPALAGLNHDQRYQEIVGKVGFTPS